jgi:hypothetical protein
MNHLGVKDDYITLLPFFNLLLSQKYINTLEHIFVESYLKVACTYLEQVNPTITMPEVLGCNANINYLLYVNTNQIESYNLDSIIITAPNILNETNKQILVVSQYLPTNTTDIFSILANSSILSPDDNIEKKAHNNEVQRFTNAGYTFSTIYPLEQFVNCLPIKGIRASISDYTFIVYTN